MKIKFSCKDEEGTVVPHFEKYICAEDGTEFVCFAFVFKFGTASKVITLVEALKSKGYRVYMTTYCDENEHTEEMHVEI